MKLRQVVLILLLFIVFRAVAQGNRWSEEQIGQWYNQQEWLCGMNYIPANAINYTAMWDKTGFSPEVIDREMALAQKNGFNCARVVLQYAVYKDDPKYFKKTFDRFLAICDKYDIRVMPCFFDDCAFGVNTDPVIGKQPEPLEGWYAWAWSPSPGYSMVIDERTHSELEKYVKEIMTQFKHDKRILVWDLYNEPTNTTMPERSIPLVKKVFSWARAVNPDQPLTIGIWNGNKELNDYIVENTDLITFHRYSSLKETAEDITRMKSYNRPVICTEWMNRTVKSTILDILPLFKEENVGCMLWGLVNGKTQTHLPWGHRPEKLPYTGVWQHDLFDGNFKPYDEAEIELVKKLTNAK